MARQNGAWVEYSTTNEHAQPTIERVHSSELKALRSAVDSRQAVVFVEYGETIDEALARVAAAPAKGGES